MDSQNERHLQVDCVVARILMLRAYAALMNVQRDPMSDVGEIDYVRYFRCCRAVQDYAVAVERYRRAVRAWIDHVLNAERSSCLSNIPRSYCRTGVERVDPEDQK